MAITITSQDMTRILQTINTADDYAECDIIDAYGVRLTITQSNDIHDDTTNAFIGYVGTPLNIGLRNVSIVYGDNGDGWMILDEFDSIHEFIRIQD